MSSDKSAPFRQITTRGDILYALDIYGFVWEYNPPKTLHTGENYPAGWYRLSNHRHELQHDKD